MFGDPSWVVAIKDQIGTTMSQFIQDLRFSVRTLAKRPTFLFAVVLTLGLGIGANTAIFSVVNAVLLKPLPYQDPDRLVLLWQNLTSTGFTKAPVTPPDFLDYQRGTSTFEGLAASNNTPTASLTGDGPPEEINFGGVTTNFFSVLGVEPVLGRDFLPEEGEPFPPSAFANPNSPPTTAIMLSHGLWTRRYAQDSTIIGETIMVNGFPRMVVGVMPPGFRLLMPQGSGMVTDVDAWSPLRFNFAQAPRNNGTLRVIGRLKPGATLAEAEEELEAIAQHHRETYEYHKNGQIFVELYPMHQDVVGHVEPTLLALLGAVGFVLLIACANVASLLLVRASARQKELAIRAALGSGKAAIVRQVMTESLVLAVLGGGLGLLIARWGIDTIVALRPENLPRLDRVGFDLNVLGFTLGASLVAALLFGILPALQATRNNVAGALKEGAPEQGTKARQRVRNVLVLAEVALSLVLLVGAGLMFRSLQHLQRVEPGFQSENVLTFKATPAFRRYPQPLDRVNFFEKLEYRISSLPGVEEVGAVFPLPLGGRFWTGPYAVPGSAQESWSDNEANYRTITPGYFRAMGTRLIAGRYFKDVENLENRPVVIVDELMAKRVWPGKEPIGRELRVHHLPSNGRVWVKVVGVVEHTRHDDLTQDGRETIYFPVHFQGAFPGMSVVVKTIRKPWGLANAVSDEVTALDPEIPVYGVQTMQQYVNEALAPTRFVLILISAFSVVAVVLAAVGVYGVVSSLVRHRTHEIGVRIAFGAGRGQILRLVLGHALVLAVGGVGLGLVASLALTRVIASRLYGVTPSDPLTLIVMAGVLALTAVAASYIPARRALKVDPVLALKTE